ncbi:MAG: HypC/HybG/HupF family hydrogenase formation chaperone [Candidatus Helarchaeota archaeon]|nr:HypC/HybG/HupF family hydrogenase formation chaperone [Candidatus Helarchaeota archaeon]
MCLAIPAKVLEIEGEYAKVDFGGIIKKVLINLLEKVEVGQYVIVHAGYAIEVMSEEEGVKTKLLIEEMLTSLD